MTDSINSRWPLKLDWANILNKLNLSSIDQIPRLKIDKAISIINELYSPNVLLNLSLNELDELMVIQLRKLMKKYLSKIKIKQNNFTESVNNINLFQPFDNCIQKNFRDLKSKKEFTKILKIMLICFSIAMLITTFIFILDLFIPLDLTKIYKFLRILLKRLNFF